MLQSVVIESGQKLLHGWTREFQDRGAYLWLTHYCRCPGDDTVSVPIYQNLSPLPAWPPLDWRKPASSTCLLTSSRAGTPLAAASALHLTWTHQAASQASVPRCLLFSQPLGCWLFHLYFRAVISHSTKWASPSISALSSFLNSTCSFSFPV